jgi:hypothetical protein
VDRLEVTEGDLAAALEACLFPEGAGGSAAAAVVPGTAKGAERRTWGGGEARTGVVVPSAMLTEPGKGAELRAVQVDADVPGGPVDGRSGYVSLRQVVERRE